MTGRGICIIDTLHPVEVARAIPFVRETSALSTTEHEQVKQWFLDYLQWMTTSRNGMEEPDARKNHGTCWVMQVAQFAQYTGNRQLVEY